MPWSTSDWWRIKGFLAIFISAFVPLSVAPGAAFALETSLMSRSHVGGTRGCCFHDDGEILNLQTGSASGMLHSSTDGPLATALAWGSFDATEGVIRGFARSEVAGNGNSSASFSVSLQEFFTLGIAEGVALPINSTMFVSMPVSFEVIGRVGVGAGFTLRRCDNEACTVGPVLQRQIPLYPWFGEGFHEYTVSGWQTLVPGASLRYLIAMGIAGTSELTYMTSPFNGTLTQLDFSNSAYLSVVLPEGVTFTSDSGLFLSPIPEPTSLVLMIGGLLALSRLTSSSSPKV